MGKPKLFLASSGKKKELAKALQTKIEECQEGENVAVNVVPWFREAAFVPGKDTLTSLIDHCRGSDDDTASASDFFAVLLTGDDHSEKADQTGDIPRDNCIFELGLFIGGLGFDPTRCFMVSAVQDYMLPSDLKGRTHITINEPEDLSNKDQCVTLEDAASLIKKIIKAKRPYARPEFASIPASEILHRERVTSADDRSEGADLLEGGEVLLSMPPPFGRSGLFAAQILDNMKAGITYRCYVRKFDPDKLVHFVWSLAKVNSGQKQPLAEQAEIIRSNFKLLRSRLSINMSPVPNSLQFVIHNASDPNRAICYLRLPFAGQEKYLQFATFETAFEMAEGLREISMRASDLQERFIFRPSRMVSQSSSPYLGQVSQLEWPIKDSIDEKFDNSVLKAALEAWFGTRSAAAGSG